MKKTNGKPTYAGRISNGGAQVVKAPFTPPKRTGTTKTTVKKNK